LALAAINPISALEIIQSQELRNIAEEVSERLKRVVERFSRDAYRPVCGMKVVPGETKLVALYKGYSYRFCAETCRNAFEANQQKYLEPKPAKLKGPKGWWGAAWSGW